MFYFFVLLLFVMGAGAAYFWFQGHAGGGAGLFGGPSHRRTGIVEVTTIKGGRKLLLIRRDDVEHLVMTGGPVDVVVETGIIARPVAHIQSGHDGAGRADPLFVPPEQAVRKAGRGHMPPS